VTLVVPEPRATLGAAAAHQAGARP
jgi:hypothetical protein